MQITAICTYITISCLFSYLWIEFEAMILLFMLLFTDTIFGIAKSYVLYNDPTATYEDWTPRNKWFNSHKLKIGVLSKILLLIIPPLVAWVFKINWINAWFLISGWLWLLCVAELISIIQNFIMIRTGKEIEEFDAITFVLKKILSFIREFLESKMNTK